MEWILETERLGFRRIAPSDFESLCKILMDPQVMYAWDHPFSEEEVTEWIGENLRRYEHEGYSFFAAIEKASGALIGVMGPLLENISGVSRLGVAYLLRHDFWRRGYAVEGVGACIDYGFHTLGATEVIAQIRFDNQASCRVVEKIGMIRVGEYNRIDHGKEVPHLIYQICV